jgi:N6-L-threonylcarbamoyladenine synthase
MTIVAIETSCDETAVALLRGKDLLAAEVASQTAAHKPYGGVVPEIASRNHLVHAPRLLKRALAAADISLGEVDAFAATAGPGLASSLMIGASMAKGLALGRGRPYLAINHLEGHLLSPFFGGEVQSNVSLVVSGGHTLLVDVRGVDDYHLLGQTVDDAAGEAFDKVAKMLGLGYPGGPEIERHALEGDGGRFAFPRSMLDSGDYNFSFSGLKTAVRYLLPKIGLAVSAAVIPSESEEPRNAENEFAKSGTFALDDQLLADLCASFQQAVLDILVQKTLRAAGGARCSLVTLSGGVSCNRALREQLASACAEAGLLFMAAPPQLATDNAAMIAFAASLRFARGQTSSVLEEIDPNLPLT